MDSELFTNYHVKCKKCFLAVSNIDLATSHASVCSGQPVPEALELVAERAKLSVLVSMVEAFTGKKLDSIFGHSSNVVPSLPISQEVPTPSIAPSSEHESTPVVEHAPTPKTVKRLTRTTKKPLPPITDASEDEKIDRMLYRISHRKTLFFSTKYEDIIERLPTVSNFEAAKDDRLRLVKYMSGRDWEETVRRQWSSFKNSAESNEPNAHRYFTTLELRVVNHNMENRVMNSDDIDWYKSALSMRERQEETFNLDKFTDFFINLRLITCPIQKILTEYFQTAPGHIGYCPQIGRVDPFGFFVKRKDGWEYDQRLEAVSEQLFSEITRYLVYYFKKFYIQVFKTNDYSSRLFDGASSVYDSEMRQILENMVWCESQAKFTKNLMDLVRKHCVIQTTVPDHVDDRDKCKRFKQECKESNPHRLMYSLFDSIETENIAELLSKIKTKL